MARHVSVWIARDCGNRDMPCSTSWCTTYGGLVRIAAKFSGHDTATACGAARRVSGQPMQGPLRAAAGGGVGGGGDTGQAQVGDADDALELHELVVLARRHGRQQQVLRAH